MNKPGNLFFPVIDLKATGRRIFRLRRERFLTVRDLQDYLGFEKPQAIYSWQDGSNLPSVDNLLALSKLFNVPIESIIVEKKIPWSALRRADGSSREQIYVFGGRVCWVVCETEDYGGL